MTRVIRVALLPLVLAWSLARLLLGPALIVVLGWWLIPAGSVWFVLLASLVGLYLVVAFTAWKAGVRGELRSLTRGVVRVAAAGRGRRPRRGKR
ncbi:hypothetical protein [Actinokineospora iranica]|uniref:Uncharacterized protein n=1 Tax=Actinokineospora iranica TaxID=1271860 RepID=A0A1G6YZ37_9PSEU|nr:hypothetical protein [Actinokineospora iranica]SDD94826.1 hypothetical protein SAMN05216174_12415 [Actinokineospora iranica]